MTTVRKGLQDEGIDQWMAEHSAYQLARDPRFAARHELEAGYSK